MPNYEYRCDQCDHKFEIFQSIKDEALILCPKCGHDSLKKLVSMPAGLIFKGTGFYITDYKKSATSEAGNSQPKKSDSSKESPSVSKSRSSDQGSSERGSSDRGSSGSTESFSSNESEFKSSKKVTKPESSKKESKPDSSSSKKKG
ncbi:zinc ribbon domain-containing protein [bacterium]|nr:MAG: zinc ribbon domain-containing protein [bacterium]